MIALTSIQVEAQTRIKILIPSPSEEEVDKCPTNHFSWDGKCICGKEDPRLKKLIEDISWKWKRDSLDQIRSEMIKCAKRISPLGEKYMFEECKPLTEKKSILSKNVYEDRFYSGMYYETYFKPDFYVWLFMRMHMSKNEERGVMYKVAYKASLSVYARIIKTEKAREYIEGKIILSDGEKLCLIINHAYKFYTEDITTNNQLYSLLVDKALKELRASTKKGTDTYYALNGIETLIQQ